jgi:hypothetical protein
MPRDGHPLKPPDISFLVGKLIFVWIVMLLFPVRPVLPKIRSTILELFSFPILKLIT